MGRTIVEIEEVSIKYGKLLDSLFDNIEIRLFGSYYHRKSHKYSDIDLAIISTDFLGMDYIIALKLLNRLKVNIDNDIEPIALTPHELTDPQIGSIAFEIAQNSRIIFKSSL